ncbi:beta-agarase [Flammeovirga sp. EKP202]|uniref:beta-agarase n=1 Tax=Flammeovirga sp. EKP202 TaxID=2770592 RepID=UPI00165FEDEE|nr:beta-agarase [Flammeovirga sp. EKP202]MBD0401967.1 beta-agarase [Flammeovirga sp. EKP202]
MKTSLILTLFLYLLSPYIFGQTTTVEVLLDHKYSVDGYSDFDRKKYIVLHSTQLENDFRGLEPLKDYIINDLDVYLGRNNGIMGGVMQRSSENPNKKGYVNPDYMQKAGKDYRLKTYGKKGKATHQYEPRVDEMVGGQVHYFWTGHSSNRKHPEKGWTIQGGDAIGDFMGQFINEFYRNENEPVTKGPLRPKYVEVINEPLWELIDGVKETSERKTVKEVFQFHNDASIAFKKHNQDVMIGGYTTAFPFFDDRNFGQWNERMKLFYDMSGEHMDFVSIHLYDFNKHHLGDNNPSTFDGPINYSGGRIEATLDLMEAYSLKQYDKVIPILISEYGGRDHSTEWKPWFAERDWDFMKSMSPMMIQFMQRPNHILKAIPFMIPKAEWGRKKNPYPWRLLRQEFELEGDSKQWVFTEQIKFYELWSEVKGERVATSNTNQNLLTDAYIDQKTAYIIVSNLERNPQTVQLNALGIKDKNIKSVSIKQLYLHEHQPKLDNTTIQLQDEIKIESEATIIVKIDLKKDVKLKKEVVEKKYYSNQVLNEITPNKPIEYHFNGLVPGNIATAQLRIGVGRPHDTSAFPSVVINGESVDYTKEIQGASQHLRKQFFTLINIDLPVEVLKEDNKISITCPDNGGHVSSVALKILEDKDIVK